MESILVKGNNWLGDAVMSLPAIRGLREMFPQSRIAVLTKQNLAQLYEAAPYVDEVIGYASWFEAVRRIRRQKFEACLIFPRSFSSAFLTTIARIPKRIGYEGDSRSILLTVPVPRSPEFLKTHRVYYFYNLLRGFGRPPAIQPPTLDIPHEFAAWAEKQVDSKLLIGFNPGATYGEAKQWFPERFIDLGRRLVKNFDATIAVFGGPSEAPLGAEVTRGIGRDAVNFSGKTSILQLAALVARCSLFVTNDTGPMHVADAVGVPIVAVFGSTDPVTTRPFGRSHSVVRHAMDCSPCLERTCPLKHHNCMKFVTVDEVYDACFRLLKKK